MKSFMISIFAGLFVIANAYGFDTQAKTHIIELYNITRNQYILIVNLLDDVSNSKIDTATAKEKIDKWKTRYHKKTDEYIPQEAEKMCGLMDKIIDISENIVDDYDPHNQRTKDMFNDLEDAKKALLHEMDELKYMLQ